MRSKLLVLSALTCIAGGSSLLAPASAQGSYPTCESLLWTPCRSGSTVICTNADGEVEPLFCPDRADMGWVYSA